MSRPVPSTASTVTQSQPRRLVGTGEASTPPLGVAAIRDESQGSVGVSRHCKTRCRQIIGQKIVYFTRRIRPSKQGDVVDVINP